MALLTTLFFHNSLMAQDESGGGGGGSRKQQIGASIGRVLPNGVDGADEIFSLWGVRYSYPVGGDSGFLDLGGLFGNSEGVNWQSAFAGISMHIPVETLVGHAGVGVDFTRYETSTTESQNVFGGHFIGGVMTQISGNAHARFDMKLNSKPGTSLFFGLGLVFEVDFGGGGSGGGAE